MPKRDSMTFYAVYSMVGDVLNDHLFFEYFAIRFRLFRVIQFCFCDPSVMIFAAFCLCLGCFRVLCCCYRVFVMCLRLLRYCVFNTRLDLFNSFIAILLS